MKTRINLTIEKDLIDQIKSYAAKRHTSVSDLVEAYFTRMVRPAEKENFIELINNLPKPGIDDDLDLKKAFYEEQSAKYGI